MGGVGQDATRHPYHLGHALAGPHLAAEAIGLGALLQQGRQAGELRMSEACWGSRGWPMTQRVRPAVPSACHPLTDRPFADAQGGGDLALGPALL